MSRFDMALFSGRRRRTQSCSRLSSGQSSPRCVATGTIRISDRPRAGCVVPSSPRAGRERTTGAGILTLPDDGRHEGEFRGGRGMEWPEVPHGQGVLTYRDGGRYEGAFEDGKQHGQGVLTMPDGMRHEGEFRDGEPV